MSKFYICKICGNLVEKIEDSGLAPFCCGKKMTYLEPNETEGAGEKHIPIITVNKLSSLESCNFPVVVVNVKVGSTPHPSLNNHYIKWIQLETNKNVYRAALQSNDIPSVNFNICGEEKIIAAYAYCNIHGLWVNNKVST